MTRLHRPAPATTTTLVPRDDVAALMARSRTVSLTTTSGHAIELRRKGDGKATLELVIEVRDGQSCKRAAKLSRSLWCGMDVARRVYSTAEVQVGSWALVRYHGDERDLMILALGYSNGDTGTNEAQRSGLILARSGGYDGTLVQITA